MQSEFDSLVSLCSTVLGVALVIDIIDATDFELSLLSPLLCLYRRPVASSVLPLTPLSLRCAPLRR